MSWIFRRAATFALLASGLLGLGCSGVETPGALSFRPTKAGSELWLATPFAIELKNERDAREIEAEDATYVGEIGIREGHVRPPTIAMIAAECGATHFRVVMAERRVDIVLYRVDRDRWAKLSGSLRPASPTASL